MRKKIPYNEMLLTWFFNARLSPFEFSETENAFMDIAMKIHTRIDLMGDEIGVDS